MRSIVKRNEMRLRCFPKKRSSIFEKEKVQFVYYLLSRSIYLSGQFSPFTEHRSACFCSFIFGQKSPI